MILPIKLFADALHDEFASWALGFAPFGGADVGELRAIASQVKDGDDAGYYAAWSAAAQRHLDAARHEAAAGRRASAHEDALQAACLFGPAMHIVYGAPVDPRLTRRVHLRDRGVRAGDADTSRSGRAARRAAGRSHDARVLRPRGGTGR